MPAQWTSELRRIILTVLLFLVAGGITGYVLECLLAGVLSILARHLWGLYHLTRWLEQSKKFHLPESSGIWELIFQRIWQMQQLNRKRKRKLGARLSQFQASLSAMPDCVVLLGKSDEILWFNYAARDLFGLEEKTDIGQPISNFIRNPAFISYLEAKNGDQELQFNPAADTGQALSVRVVPYYGKRRLLVARDVTELQRLDRIRRDFVANVSHELRTPLTVISGFIENMRTEESGMPHKWRRPLSLMEQQTSRMQRIVNDLLLLAGLESNQIKNADQPVAVAELLGQIREEVLSQEGNGSRDIRLEVDSGLRLNGQEQELHSAFSNLIVNAIRHTPKEGAITLRWFGNEIGARVEIEDTGEGIPTKHIPRLTERFYRVDTGRSRAQGGTGLGLAIVKHVLQHHEAELEIESEPGEGSLFCCRFPMHRVIVKKTAMAQ